MTAMYGGACGIAAALFVMTPITADGSGSYGVPKPDIGGTVANPTRA